MVDGMGLGRALSHLASYPSSPVTRRQGSIQEGGAAFEERAERNSRILPRMARAISARMHWPSASPRSQPDAQTGKPRRHPWLSQRRQRRGNDVCVFLEAVGWELMTVGGVSCKPCGKAVILWPSHRCLEVGGVTRFSCSPLSQRVGVQQVCTGNRSIWRLTIQRTCKLHTTDHMQPVYEIPLCPVV
ncbi:hypothetical protein J3E69DRAFT_342032 [Trichoderma sp. SZMC 28015]